MIIEEQLILLLIVAAAVAMLAQRLRLPYTVALVVTGLALGALSLEVELHLNKELVFAVFLPALLYEAAFHLDVSHFKRDAGPILILAVLGVVISLLICGGLTFLGLQYVIGYAQFGILYALLFGALISATDPISVIAIFKELGVPHRLHLVVEGESLFNDGTAVVMFSLLLAAVAGHDAHGETVKHIGALWVAGSFLKEVLGGLGVGLVTGLAMSYLTARVDDHLIEIMLTTILAYGSYIIAEHLHVSGVIAVVAAGMMSGNYGASVGMSPTTKMAVVSFWEFAAFIINSIIFLLIGMEAKLSILLSYSGHIIIAWLAVLVARAASVTLLLPLINGLFHKFPWKWSPIMIWGGLRGSISMALVLSLDRNMPHRELILSMTFGVVVLSILGQALTIKPLLKKLGVLHGGGHAQYQELAAGIKSAHAAMTELEELYGARSISRFVHEKLLQEYKEKLAQNETAIGEIYETTRELHDEETRATRRHLLAMEKDELKKAYAMGMLSESSLKKLVNQLDGRLDQLIEKESVHKDPS